MKFNFFVLIASLMIHFIAQAGSGKKADQQPSKETAQIKTERTVASDCNCDPSK